MAKTYDVKLTRTTVEEASLTVEAKTERQAAYSAGLLASSAEWSPKSTTVDLSEVLWKQGEE